MSIVVLKPTPLASELFTVDPVSQMPSSMILSTEEYGDGVIPFVGQKIDRNGVTLVVMSVDTESDDGGNYLYRAVVGLEKET
ncbi:hypothetical protein [Acidihalobacter aeolianus]|uniref:hypothetical protein n=1 Tax=Acidihalobacter aeolianus TaxID=2792603 RepID=UPI0012E9AF17|nr:hypothetical protein [Acidihalobacter aeolianus]